MTGERSQLELCIVIGGPICSGKTALAHSLADVLRCPVVSFGDYVRSRASELGLGNDRRTLQSLGALLTTDADTFVRDFLLASRTQDTCHVLVIDGLRHVSIANGLREAEFSRRLLIALVRTPREERQRRYLARGEGSLAEFEAAEVHPVEAEHATLEAKADVIVRGDEPLEDAVAAILSWGAAS